MHGTKLLRGWACRYGVLTEPHGTGHRTVLHEGCFADSIECNEVTMVLDHDGSKLLGSTSDGSLVISDSPGGIGFCLQGDHHYGAHVLDNLRSLGIRECSIHYTQKESDRAGDVVYVHRAILHHVSLLTGGSLGACPGTSAELFLDLYHAPRRKRHDLRFLKSFVTRCMRPPKPRRKPRPATRPRLDDQQYQTGARPVNGGRVVRVRTTCGLFG